MNCELTNYCPENRNVSQNGYHYTGTKQNIPKYPDTKWHFSIFIIFFFIKQFFHRYVLNTSIWSHVYRQCDRENWEEVSKDAAFCRAIRVRPRPEYIYRERDRRLALFNFLREFSNRCTLNYCIMYMSVGTDVRLIQIFRNQGGQ